MRSTEPSDGSDSSESQRPMSSAVPATASFGATSPGIACSTASNQPYASSGSSFISEQIPMYHCTRHESPCCTDTSRSNSSAVSTSSSSRCARASARSISSDGCAADVGCPSSERNPSARAAWMESSVCLGSLSAAELSSPAAGSVGSTSGTGSARAMSTGS